jgi:uncharacterized protein YndB with AHSA1/START domain
VPTTKRQRTIAAPPEAVWRVVGDANHLPRWWPRVRRVEAVSEAGWTKVFMTGKGRPVRADYTLLETEPPRAISWSQELEDSPFERLMDEAVTEVRLAPAASPEGDVTDVTIVLRQRLRGWARFAPFLVKRGTRRLLDEALDGLEQCTAR